MLACIPQCVYRDKEPYMCTVSPRADACVVDAGKVSALLLDDCREVWLDAPMVDMELVALFVLGSKCDKTTSRSAAYLNEKEIAFHTLPLCAAPKDDIFAAFQTQMDTIQW